ncbi:MAG: NUDIX hydrolase [Clostridia bacterium]|nr:NUDIX hydrolase [Clostridia bacterium]
MGNGYYTVCGIVEIEGKVLLVRHTYGNAKDRILVPGGYVEDNELPNLAVEREILEETGVVARAKSLSAIQFKSNQWCPVFVCEYVSGTPKSDNYENSEVLLLDIDKAINRSDITNMSREILKIYKGNRNNVLLKSDYLAKNTTDQNYALFG